MPSHPPPPTISPTKAARDLRLGIRSALNHWVESSDVQALKNRVDALNHRRFQRAEKVDLAVTQLLAALDARRTKEAREHLSSLVSYLRDERALMDAITMRVADTSDARVLSRDLLKHWNELVQCLPTHEDIPVGKEQNVLRAIIAILRANNIGDLGAMTQVVEDQEGAADGS